MSNKKIVHHNDKTKERFSKVEPATLINVKVVEIEKTIEVPRFVEVEIEKPVYINKEFEVPVLVEKEYEKPVIVEKEYEKPVIVEKMYNVEIPVAVKKEYDKFIPKEVIYEVPVVVMQRINELAEKINETASMTRAMLREISSSIDILNTAIDTAGASIPKKIIVPEIITEKHVVKDIEIIKDTIHVIGKVVARKDI